MLSSVNYFLTDNWHSYRNKPRENEVSDKRIAKESLQESSISFLIFIPKNHEYGPTKGNE